MMINKKEFIDQFAANAEITKRDAELCVDKFLGTVTEFLKNGDDVRFIGFGTFGTKQTPAHSGTDPRTGRAVAVPEKTKPFFKSGKSLKDAVNE